MRYAILAFFVLALAQPATAAAAPAQPDADDPAFPNQEACHVTLPEGDWTPQEHWTWEQICLGRVADLSGYARTKPGLSEYACDTSRAEAWPDHSVLSNAFLNLVLAHPDYRAATSRKGVRIRCAKFAERIDISNITTPNPLWLDASFFRNGLDAFDFTSDAVVSLNGSRFAGPFDGGGLAVGGVLFMRELAAFKRVVLTSAKIGSNLEADGASFENIFSGDDLSVGGNVFVRDGASFQRVNLIGATVGGNLNANDSSFEGLFNASRLSVSGSLFMQDGASFQGINLIGAKVGSNLEANRSKFEGLFKAVRLSVDGSLFMRDGASFRGVRLASARIGGQLDLRASRVMGHFDLTHAEIGRDLMLGAADSESVAWEGDDAALTLRNTAVAAIQDLPGAWDLPKGALDLNGFTYSHLGGLQAEKGSSMAARPVSWLRDKWLALQADRDTVFQPQPYRQLAAALRDAGYAGKADAILIAMNNHKRDHATTSWDQSAWLWARWALLGYGYEPARTLYWFVGLVAVGWGVTTMSRRGRQETAWRRLFLSVEAAVPLVDLTPQNAEFAHELPEAVDRYLQVHKIIGLFLASVLVAGMTGIVR